MNHRTAQGSRRLFQILLSISFFASCAPGPRSLRDLVSLGPQDTVTPARRPTVAAVARAFEAELVLQRGDFELACSCFDEALELESDDAGLWARAALAFLACGRTPDAQRAAARALSLDSALCEAWIAAQKALEASADASGSALALQAQQALCPRKNSSQNHRFTRTNQLTLFKP
ncbi:MAG: hypothetical protein MUC50_12555 [Myxococcota bacterium]|jgi:tetratricopeptide (TPR) repeat protein|nr:hypothetical protein [Myxococcota bacterium]